MLTTLINNIYTYLSSLPPEDWGEIKPNATDLPFVKAQDPDQILKCKTRTIFLIPMQYNYNLEGSSRRGVVRQLGIEYTVSTILVYPMETLMKGDLAAWDEIEKVWELRQKIDSNLFSCTTLNHDLLRIEAEQPLESQMDMRNMVLITDFTYTKQSCGAR